MGLHRMGLHRMGLHRMGLHRMGLHRLPRGLCNLDRSHALANPRCPRRGRSVPALGLSPPLTTLDGEAQPEALGDPVHPSGRVEGGRESIRRAPALSHL